MSAEALISSMEKLLKLHKSLYELAVRKTDIVKTGDMDALNQLIKDEQKHHAAISMVEKERQVQAGMLVPSGEQTISECLDVLQGEERFRLASLRDELLSIVYKVQQQNELNQQLTLQSLQFVNLSMSLVAPNQDDYNYGNPAHHQETNAAAKSLFSSKA